MKRLYLIGGFLGSGKTTAICQACEILSSAGEQVAVITNDQGMRLVDGAWARGLGLSGREVKGGCFCCRYDELQEAIGSLDRAEQPALIFAESVGSCTDIVATVVKPLALVFPSVKVYLTVFLDAGLLAKAARNESPFSDPDLNYIYFCQPAEADLVIVNKWDLITETDRSLVTTFVRERFSAKRCLFQNSLETAGVKRWLDELERMQVPPTRKSLEIDYDQYGAAEAKLGWFDEELEVFSEEGRAIEVAIEMVNLIYEGVRRAGYLIGHLKFLLTEGTWQRKISFTATPQPRLRQTDSPRRLGHLTLLVNARVQCAAERLQQVVSTAKIAAEQKHPVRFASRGMEVFSPGYPRPTHRIH